MKLKHYNTLLEFVFLNNLSLFNLKQHIITTKYPHRQSTDYTVGRM